MIPKVIHYSWFGGNPLPDEYKKYIETWKKFCPDYDIIEWNESNYDVTKNKYMHDAYKAGKWAFAADYTRLDVIYNHGGIYLDTDVELIKGLDSLLENEAFMGIENGKYVNPGLGFGAVKAHETIKKLRDCYLDITFVKDNGVTGPMHQTKYLLQYKLKPKSRKIQQVAGINIFPPEYFAPKSYTSLKTKITDNTYSIHHYSLSWFSGFQKKRHAFKLKWAERFGGSRLAYKMAAGAARLIIKRDKQEV
ncbi:MAG: glycosyl transferase [Oscillospiraceae bacterium]|nr:glycosyl transferase [Oscillospiraceae bacterium]